MRIVITGGTGYLGSNLVKAFLCRGFDVTVLSRYPNERRRLKKIDVDILPTSDSGIELALRERPVDVLVHAACCYGRSGENDDEIFEANVIFGKKLAHIAGNRIGHFINIGTSLPPNVSSYAVSKHKFAEWLEEQSMEKLAPRTTIEMEHFYGNGDDEHKILTRIARSCVRDESIDLTDGTQSRDFIHVSDAVNAIEMLLEPEGDQIRYVSVGSGEAITVRQVASLIQLNAQGGILNFGAINSRPNEPVSSVADITKLQSFGWNAKVTIEDGIAGLVKSEKMRLGGR